MNTNLLPAVFVISSTLVTNVLTGDNHRGCSICGSLASPQGYTYGIYHPWHSDGLPYVPATEWWVITNVTREVKYTATVNGEPMVFNKSELLSSTTNWEHSVTTRVPGRLPGILYLGATNWVTSGVATLTNDLKNSTTITIRRGTTKVTNTYWNIVSEFPTITVVTNTK